MNAKLNEYLKKLRLSGMGQSLEVRLQEATANRLDHAEFLELVWPTSWPCAMSGRSPAA